MKEIPFTITQQDINVYSNVSGDYNPIHLDDHYAKTYGFSEKIAHGMLTMAKIWSVLSANFLTPKDLPNEYVLTFLSPVYVGDLVVLQIAPQGNRLQIKGTCKGKTVVKGFISIGSGTFHSPEYVINDK